MSYGKSFSRVASLRSFVGVPLVSAMVFAAPIVAALANFGCATTNASGEHERTLGRSRRVVGRYGSERFDFSGRRMSIRLLDGRIAPSDAWTMVNIAEDSPRGEFVSKEGDAWVSELRFDVEGSGIEEDREFVPRYDILMRHRTTGASLSMRTHALSSWADRVTLRGLADARIDADSSEFALAIADGTSAAIALDSTERVAVLRGGLAVAVDFAEAYAFEYRILDANRYELGLPQSPYRVRTIFIRPSWGWTLAGRRWPVVVELTLSARDADFDEVANALDDFVGRLGLSRVDDADGLPRATADAVRACFASAPTRTGSVSLRFSFDRRTSTVSLVAYAIDNAAFAAVSAVSPVSRCIENATRQVHASQGEVFVVELPRTGGPVGVEAFSSGIWSRLVAAQATSTPPASPSAPAVVVP